jgi:hypothetical protein
MGNLLAEIGDAARARAHRDKGFKNDFLTTLPYRGERPPVRVLLLVSAAGGNTPTARGATAWRRPKLELKRAFGRTTRESPLCAESDRQQSKDRVSRRASSGLMRRSDIRLSA